MNPTKKQKKKAKQEEESDLDEDTFYEFTTDYKNLLSDKSKK